jgi:hypothetical protein
MNKFWIYDPSILLNKYWEVLPTRDMTFVDQLNTISRFLIYLIIILVLFNHNSVILLLAIVLLVVIIIYHSLYVNDVKSISLDVNENFVDEYNNYKEVNKPIIDNPISNIKSNDMIKKVTKGAIVGNGGPKSTFGGTTVDRGNYSKDIGVVGIAGTGVISSGKDTFGDSDFITKGTDTNTYTDIAQTGKDSYYSTVINDNPSSMVINAIDTGSLNKVDYNNVDIQTAYIDSNGDYVFGDLKKDSNVRGDEGSFFKDGGGGGCGGGCDGNGDNSTYKMNNDYVNSTCRKPTVDNPYANIVFSDYLDAGNVASPCNVDDDELPKKSLALYNSSIFRNVDDVFERENSQRLFYTLPINTIPNKQTEFARWLYDTGPRCKEDTSKCTYYEDPSMTSPRY